MYREGSLIVESDFDKQLSDIVNTVYTKVKKVPLDIPIAEEQEKEPSSE